MKKRIALVDNNFSEIDENEIDYELDSPQKFYGSHINMIPLQSAVASPRLFYGSRFYNQAVPLKKREAAYVQNLYENDKSFDDLMGEEGGALRSKFRGTVKSVDNDYITVFDEDEQKEKQIELYNNFSFNRYTSLHQTPKVKPGDVIDKGSLLATSNFTDDNGTLSLGTNARVALVPYKGYGYEDATVISEDFAKKLTSEHTFGTNFEFKKGIKGGKNHFLALFSNKFTKDQLSNLTDDGYIKEGSIVNPGDPLILASEPRVVSSTSMLSGKMSKNLKNSRNDASVVWEYSTPGKVIDAVKTSKGIKLNIQTEMPAQLGDKVSFRSGQKTTISKIIPMSEMPRSADGEPYDMLLNPLGIPSRVNNSMVYEILLGKAAKAKGQPFKLPSYLPEGSKWFNLVREKLDELGLSDKEEIYDPKLNRTLENAATAGNAYVMKLQHMSELKMSARGTGAYTQNEQPLKGGDEAAMSKRMSGLETNAILSSGAYNVLKDTATVRGQKNDEYWKQIRMGQKPHNPKHPFIWDKFNAFMMGSGFSANNLGAGQLRLGPITDKKIEELKPIEIKSGDIIDLKTGEPIAGGLFDNSLVGANRWGKITLPFPVPNPAFEEPILKMLDLTKKEFQSVFKGESTLDNGESGPDAIYDALSKINLDELKEDAVKTIKSGAKSKRGRAIKLLNYVEGLQRNELEPKDLMIKKLPVVPPKFRPFSIMGETFVPGDVNELYKSVIETRDSWSKINKLLGDEGSSNERINLYNAVKALAGHGEPITDDLKKREIGGFFKKITGSNPKFSMFQREMISKTVDLSGRAVIGVDPELSINEVGIPKEMAWKMFSPFIQRRLVKQGIPPVEAIKMIQNQHDLADKALQQEVKERPVIYSRAPAWHKYNSLGGWAKLIEGSSIMINPLVTTGLTADFNGDNQIAKIFILMEKNKNHNIILTNYVDIQTVDLMINKNIIPIFDKEKYNLHFIDLEDFPKGEYIGTNKNGKNGVIHFFKPAQPIKVISFDEITMSPVWADVSTYSIHPDREVELVNLCNDRQITTDDDPRAIYGLNPKTNEYERATPSVAKEKNIIIPVVKNIDIACSNLGKLNEIPLTDENNNIVFNFPLNKDTGYLLGALAGDGWWDKKEFFHTFSVLLADKEGFVASKIKSILENLFGEVKYRITEHKKDFEPGRYGDSTTHSFSFKYSEEFCKFLSLWLGSKRDEKTSGSGNKTLPDFFMLANEDFRIGVLNGFIDTDGSVSVNNSKNNKQLMIQATSTSLRLLNDLKFLLLTLGIRSTVSYSKKTLKGNDSWIITISSVDSKNKNILHYLQNEYKLNNFNNIGVSQNKGTSGAYDKIYFSNYIAELISRYSYVPKITDDVKNNKELCDSYKYYSNINMSIVRASRSNLISRSSAEELLKYLTDRIEYVKSIMNVQINKLNLFTETNNLISREELNNIKKTILIVGKIFNNPDVKKHYAKLNKNIISGKDASSILEFLKLNNNLDYIFDDAIFNEWVSAVKNKNICWTGIKSIEKTGKKETGYDLTVPGFETFSTVDGVIVSNTMNVSVPALDEAVDDVKNKMMPDKMIFSTKDNESVVNLPKQEYILGLFSANKRPAKNVHRFATEAEALKAIEQGKVRLSDEIIIG